MLFLAIKCSLVQLFNCTLVQFYIFVIKARGHGFFEIFLIVRIFLSFCWIVILFSIFAGYWLLCSTEDLWKVFWTPSSKTMSTQKGIHWTIPKDFCGQLQYLSSFRNWQITKCYKNFCTSFVYWRHRMGSFECYSSQWTWNDKFIQNFHQNALPGEKQLSFADIILSLDV